MAGGRLGCPSDRRLCANYTALDVERPFLSVFAAQKCFDYILAFSAGLSGPGTGFELGEAGQNSVLSV